MQIIKSRPIPLPVWKSGKWYDDFAVTGVTHSGYSISSGNKIKTGYGIQLNATTATTGALNLPAWYRASNFEIETVMRLVAGTDMSVIVRFLDALNFIEISLTSSQLTLNKVVSDAYTALATINGVAGNSFQKIGLRAIGPFLKMYLNSKQVASVTETNNITNNNFRIQTYASIIGTAKAEFQYLAINPK